MPVIEQEEISRPSEDIRDIITTPPSWILRWGISIFFVVLIVIISLSSIIKYPDIIKTTLIINSSNSPKPVVSKVTGKLIKILVTDAQNVKKNAPLAFLESTAAHEDVLMLLKNLQIIQRQLLNDEEPTLSWVNTPVTLQLGEIQSSYQNFFQSYLTYKASITDGYYLKERVYLQKDLRTILKKKKQLIAQQTLQQKTVELAGAQFEMHKKLAEQKVEAKMELKREEMAYIQQKYPLEQINTAIIDNSSAYETKEKEILELNNQINEEKSKFLQSINSFISEVEGWKNKYILYASQDGKLSFAGTIQENQTVTVGEEIFYIDPGDGNFFGEMAIPQYNMGKVRKGQRVLVKLISYPFEEYGIIRGNISYVADIPFNDSIFVSHVSFKSDAYLELKRPITLKNGMRANAEIITEDASLIERVSRSIIKVLR